MVRSSLTPIVVRRVVLHLLFRFIKVHGTLSNYAATPPALLSTRRNLVELDPYYVRRAASRELHLLFRHTHARAHAHTIEVSNYAAKPLALLSTTY